MRLWEYERDSFLTKLHLSGSEIEALQSDRYISNAGAQLLLALNCTKPNDNGQYFALYQYRCEDKPLFYVSSYALKDRGFNSEVQLTSRKEGQATVTSWPFVPARMRGTLWRYNRSLPKKNDTRFMRF
jgi:hypothetical protein